MDKKIAGLVGAVGAFAVAGQSQAAPVTQMDLEAAMHADSYADLLKPIPNAVELWKASARIPAAPVQDNAADGSGIVDVQDHHHHHHRRRHHHPHVVVAVPQDHHHHHHHHAAAVIVAPQV